MNDLGWFSISGLACAKHTIETKKIWSSWSDKTGSGRKTIIEYAKSLGFNSTANTEDRISNQDAQDAFNHIRAIHPDSFGIKSHIIRYAIINHS